MPAYTIPDADEAFRRLRHLAEHGPTQQAFTFEQRYPPPAPVPAPFGQAVV